MTWEDVEKLEALIEVFEKEAVDMTDVQEAVLILMKTAKRSFYDKLD